MKGPLLCAVLVAVVYYPKLVVMNTIMSLCVSGYHRYHLLYVDLYTVYIYRLSWALHRTALWYVSLLYLSTCNSDRGLTRHTEKPEETSHLLQSCHTYN